MAGLFPHLIPQVARDRTDIRNQSHVMVPDFRIQLPSSTPALDLAPGETETRLAELKHTCSESHYRTGRRQQQFTRAVDRKAGELMGEYHGQGRQDGHLAWRGRRRRQGKAAVGELIRGHP